MPVFPSARVPLYPCVHVPTPTVVSVCLRLRVGAFPYAYAAVFPRTLSVKKSRQKVTNFEKKLVTFYRLFLLPIFL